MKFKTLLSLAAHTFVFVAWTIAAKAAYDDQRAHPSPSTEATTSVNANAASAPVGTIGATSVSVAKDSSTPRLAAR